MSAELDAEEPFGPYLVYERLGVGGMATVHRALERGIEGFERFVALKRLLPHLAEDASFIKSFVREAKLASLLNHVNIVQIFELGRVGTEYFISMEYIDGRDLRRVLRHARKHTGPPPINVTVGLLLQLCEALEYAHSRTDELGHPLGLVHRDISPSNILVTQEGVLKMIDFGIAKAQSAQLRTQTGRVKGKLAYMAPEAIAGRELDARSDLFAVGVISHELLTARPLFASKNEYQTLMKVERGDVVPPSTYNPECPPELDDIVLHALTRDPDERFANAAALREALSAVRQNYALTTGYRDISSWLNYAFEIEGAGAVSRDEVSGSMRSISRPSRPAKTPQPRKEDDEAVEVAWGGGEHESSSPVVLDDIPDVSEKHLAAAIPGASFGADARLDPAEFPDDIPTPRPSHGQPQGRPSRELPLDEDEPILLERPAGELEDPETAISDPPVDDEPFAVATDPLAPPVPLADDEAASPPDDEPGPDPIEELAHAWRASRSSESEIIARPADPSSDDAETLTGGRASVARISPPPPVFPEPFQVPKLAKGVRWSFLLALAVAVAAAATATWYVTRPGLPAAPSAPPEAARPMGTVKFVTQPEDAEITIAGEPIHQGSPWSTKLEPGIHQIKIQRTGYKPWLTSLTLAASEVQTIRVVLESTESSPQAITEARLILSSTPSGLEVVIDGERRDLKTPIKIGIKPGPHTITLRRRGVEVWTQNIVAQSSANYELNPVVPEERPTRAKIDPPSPPREEKSAREPLPSPEKPAPAPERAPTPAPAPAPKPAITNPPPKPAVPSVTTPVPPPPQPQKPLTVPPNAVTKLSGETPRIIKLRHHDLPEHLSTLVCIDEAGKVVSARVVTKVNTRTATSVVETLRTWRYSPYKRNGTAAPACFVVGFKIQ